MEEREEDLRLLKNAAVRTFCKIPVELTDPKVIGSIVSAASNMAMASDIGSYDATYESLLEAFKAENDEETVRYSELAPQYVQSIIGYTVDFKNHGVAKAELEAAEATGIGDYNFIFGQAKYLNETKANKTL